MSPLFQIPECATAHFSTSDVAYPPFLHSNLQRLCSRDHLSFVPIVFAICEMVEYIWEKNIKSWIRNTEILVIVKVIVV